MYFCFNFDVSASPFSLDGYFLESYSTNPRKRPFLVELEGSISASGYFVVDIPKDFLFASGGQIVLTDPSRER
tara:strand:+ start:126 stop:344 length:219 start_codon:yes stop_codon:yes gene_type:complete